MAATRRAAARKDTPAVESNLRGLHHPMLASPTATAAAAAAEADLDVGKRFETPQAAAFAVALILGAQGALFVLMAQTSSWTESAPSLIWVLVLLVQHGLVLAPGVSPKTARYGTYLCSIFVAALPHLPICRRGAGRATGAAQGAASMLAICRAFETLHRIEAGSPAWEKANGRWRRVYQGTSLAWHDLDAGRARLLPDGRDRSEHTAMLKRRLAQHLALLAVPCGVITYVLPPPPTMFSASMVLRCAFMDGALVVAFNVFDTAYLFLQSAVNGIAVTSIMDGGFWSC